MFKKLVLLALLVLSNQTFAQTNAWTTVTLNYAYPLGNGDFILVFNENNPGCTNPDQFHYVKVGENGVNADGAKNMLTAAMTAGVSNKTLRVNFDKDSISCFIGRLKIVF